MFAQTFFKLFPPPDYLNIPYAGLDISEDAIRSVLLSKRSNGYLVKNFAFENLKEGIIDSGQIKLEDLLIKSLVDIRDKIKTNIVRASLPEERMYLFKMEVPTLDESEIRQLVEFKLEEYVPLSPSESVFFFDIIPSIKDSKQTYISVSVAPIELINSYLDVIKKAGFHVLSFDIQPKAISRSVVPFGSLDTEMIINIMNKKTGIYIVTGGVLCFTSTIAWGKDNSKDFKELKVEIEKVYEYWKTRGDSLIGRIMVCGNTALKNGLISSLSPDPHIPVEIAQVWRNVFDINSYIPPIPYEESLDYSVAIGLSLPIQ